MRISELAGAVSDREVLRSQVRRASARPREGLALLAGIVALMWIVEVINTATSNSLKGDGIYARNIDRFWGILTAPFIHASFQHLLDNTLPFVCLGAIVALRGAGRLLAVTAFVILIGGLGTWLVSPAQTASHRPIDTIGASGVVFGYAGYLLARGFFNRSIWELATAALVAVVWGFVLASSLVPHAGVSWQAHVCGGLAGVLFAWAQSRHERRRAARDALVAVDSR